MFTQSKILQKKGIQFKQIDNKIWQVIYQQKTYQITFDPHVFDELPSLRLMTWGEPLFEKLCHLTQLSF